MRDIKTKNTDRSPRIMDNAARAPKQLVRRSFISAKEQAQETAAKSDRSESPTEYAENRIGEQAQSAVQTVSQNTYRGGKRLAKKTQEIRRNTKQASKTAKSTAKAAKDTVKATQKTVKTAQTGVKAAQRTVKTAQHTAKAAQKAAQAAAKAAKMAAKAAQAAAKAAATAAKATVKAITAIVKAVIAAIKALIAAIAAGGWVAVVIIIVVVLVIALLSVFGVFSANEAPDGSKPMTEAIESINTEFKDAMQTKITELSAGADTVEVIYEGDMESMESPVPNWPDVIAVYSAKVGMDEAAPSDVTVVNEENISQLSAIFHDMNSVSYRTETETEQVPITDESGTIILDENGEPKTESRTTKYIYVQVTSMDYAEAARMYALNDSQNEMITELMRPDYYPLFAELLGDSVGDGGEYGFGLDIDPDLPPSELGAQIVEAAKKYIGRSYSSMDCSKLARTAYNDCGLTSMNGLSSVYMAKKCEEMGVLFTDPSQLQAGDLIFFSRFDPSRGEDYCGDTGRCGSGKCKRWLHIHHVAIYINDEFLIDSTGGNNSVQIRKHWGMDTAKWKWVCFGRPTT